MNKPVKTRNKSYWQGVRITPAQRAKLEKLARNLGVNVSGALRTLIDEAKVGEATDHA